jgi:hypothetical protein
MCVRPLSIFHENTKEKKKIVQKKKTVEKKKEGFKSNFDIKEVDKKI